jgi:simple sugar transport system substrate-binding protein
MKIAKFLQQMILFCATVILPTTGWTQNQPKILMVTHGVVSDPFWAVVKNGAEEAAKETGITVEYRSPEKFDMVAMAQLIDAAVTAKPSALIVTIPDPDAVGRSIESAVKAGIPVISINSGADSFQKLGVRTHIGQEEYIAGRAAGERMKTMVSPKGLSSATKLVTRHEISERKGSQTGFE